MDDVPPGPPAAAGGSSLKRLARVAVSAAILAVLAWRMDWDQVAAAFRALRWGQWLASLGVLMAAQVLSAIRWRWLARPLGFTEPLRRYVGLYFVGMFFNLLLPTSIGGDAVRAVGLGAGPGRRMAAFLSVLLDRLSGLLVLLALACVAAAACPVPLPAWVRLSVAATALAAVAGLAVLPASTRLLARLEIAGGGRWHQVLDKVRHLAQSLREAVELYRRRPRLLVASTALSVLIQASGVVQVALVGRAVGAEVPILVYGVAVPMVALLTLLPVSLNGMGVREAGMILFLRPAGVPAGTAVTVAFLWFCGQTAAGLAGAGAYLFGHFPRPEVRHDDAVGDHPGQGRAGQPRAAA
jgi:uncharacterized protein (TIRG00374 family)